MNNKRYAISGFSVGMIRAFLLPVVIIVMLSSHYAAGYNIIGWGSQKPPNEPLVDIVKIAAGNGNNLALKADGSIIGWGWNVGNEVTPPDGNDFIAVALGSLRGLALKADGSILGWGKMTMVSQHRRQEMIL